MKRKLIRKDSQQSSHDRQRGRFRGDLDRGNRAKDVRDRCNWSKQPPCGGTRGQCDLARHNWSIVGLCPCLYHRGRKENGNDSGHGGHMSGHGGGRICRMNGHGGGRVDRMNGHDDRSDHTNDCGSKSGCGDGGRHGRRSGHARGRHRWGGGLGIPCSGRYLKCIEMKWILT